MIIDEIQLTNIGPYKGINLFDFRTEGQKNIILIGGENGAGKTTLLNAIKLGLFGAYSFGYKTNSTDYYKRVSSILNYNAKKIGENNFRIKLKFSLIDNFEKVDYVIYRSWKFKQDNLIENYDLMANDKYLGNHEKELFQSKLREIMPPQLLDLCLFDGEKISRIVNEDLLSDYLKDLARVVFNLDLFEMLENDLENYSRQSLEIEKMESLEEELYNLNIREKKLKNNIMHLEKKINELKVTVESHYDQYYQLKNEFEQYGGLIKSEREELVKEINKIELIRKQNYEKIKEFVATLLPFYLAKDLLLQTRQQIRDEESLHLFKQFKIKLTEKKINNIAQYLPGHHTTETHHQLREQLLQMMKPEKDIIQIHGASFSESSLIENMFLKISSNSNKECLKLIIENREFLEELQLLKEKIKINDSTNEFSEMIQKMEQIRTLIIKLEVELNNDKSQLQNLLNQLETVTHSIDKIQNILKDNEKTKSSFLESQKIISISRRFREIQLQKKLQDVQLETSNILKRIFRKQNYISSVIIDHKTYDVTLLDFHKEYIEKSTLSAGEKQILLLSIIWAIFKSSGRKVPFIFDTLLGRLDKTHKTTVLKEFIPNCGKQIIILSTDTEIDEHYYKILQNRIAKEYMLMFNGEKKETHIINQYFPFV